MIQEHIDEPEGSKLSEYVNLIASTVRERLQRLCCPALRPRSLASHSLASHSTWPSLHTGPSQH